MKVFIRKVTFLVGLTLCAFVWARGQVVTSARDGLWNDPTTWDSGQVPDVANAIETVVNHNVLIPDLAAVTIRNVVVNGSLTVGVGAVVDIQPDAMPERNDLQVFGSLVMSDGATLNGTSAANTSFESGSRYVHLQGPLGFIPYAAWHPNSIFEIGGFRTQGYINIAHSDSWKQNFGHVIYNCPQQTTAFVDLNGYLRNIAGNLIVQSTNNQVLRLSTTQNPTITIGGDFVIQGLSKVWLSTTPSHAVVNVSGDFRYSSISTGISYLTTKGTVTLNVSGEFEMDSPGRIQMASTNPDSTGARISNLNLSGDLMVSNGAILAPPAPGKGTLRFAAIGSQAVTTPVSNPFSGNIDYIIEEDAIVDLGTSVLSNTTGSLLVKGTLQVGSTHALGAIQTTTSGNIQVKGTRTFQPGSTIEYNGWAPQWIGNGHPSTPGVNLLCSNPSGVTMLKDIVTGDLSVLNDLHTQLYSITTSGNIFVMEGTSFNPREINLVGNADQQISVFGSAVENLNINKPTGGVELTSPFNLSGKLIIQSVNTTFHSNGHLVLLSTSDEIGGTACIGGLQTGSSISGNVTVQRHMAGEGRIFRYISSPVQNSTVASLQDDFPITGNFVDPTNNSRNPSFYYYDQSMGGLLGGWRPYPSSGLASANLLVVGKGYAAHIRKGSGPTIWDVTGVLNQGTIELPIEFSPNNQPSNGWNLVGNPYACAIRWDEEGPNKWSMQNISSVIAIRDNGMAGGTFRYWDLDNNYSESTGGQIASGQSFWVRATGQGANLTISEGVKEPEGAAFFRVQLAPIPSFAVTLSKGTVSDVAYYKIRPTANHGLDDWDGVKLDNTEFDLSFVNADKIALAIHATDRLPCDTIVQLNLKDLTAGKYFLKISAKYDFTRYSFSLYDKYLKTETVLSPDGPILLEVTSNPGSYAFDRLSLKLKENTPKNDLRVTLPATACEYEVVGIKISGAEAGVTYSIHTIDSVFLSSGVNDSTGDLVISFPASALMPGKNIISVKANATCHVVPLLGTHAIIRESAPRIWGDPVTACSGSTVILKAFSDIPDAQFFWFNEIDAKDTIGVESVLHTEPLTKSQTYFVTSRVRRCSSEPYEVRAAIINYEPAQIKIVSDTSLGSNYLTNNVWMLNGDTIQSMNNPFLQLEQPGTYTLLTDTLGCRSSASFVYSPLEAEAKQNDLYAYPNPASDVLNVGTGKLFRGTIGIIDGQGRVVLQGESSGRKEQPIIVRELANGTYYVMLTSQGRNQIIRFIKED